MANQGFVRASRSGAGGLFAGAVGLALVALSAAACGSGSSAGEPSTPKSSETPGDTPVSSPTSSPPSPDIAPANQCAPAQFIGAEGRCFDSGQAACASPACAPSERLAQETAPARARCR